ncbi:MAG: DNA methylase [Rhizobiaceae bacterium]|nr:DNA methylase [Rhizobiaceae bacterium]
MRNSVIHGNCIEIMRDLPDASVDFVLTDPPYLCGYRDRTGRTVLHDNDDGGWLAPAFAGAFRVLKPDSVCVSFYGWNQADTFISAWRAAGFRLAGHIVFAKRYSSKARYVSYRHECAYLLIKGNPPLPENPVPDVMPWQYTHNRLHPTQKPVEPLKDLVAAFCPKDGLVLDPFCGSGSTLVAARECGRDWLGIELDADHHATATERMRRANCRLAA